ncbi:putative Type I restriction-modification methylase [uncultured Mediterranean phage uvMED]|nr:putative Type I restriction-modification methylase [uncultured Mediterranean phage uvMED]
MSRNKHDYYPTPYSIVDTVVRLVDEQWDVNRIWECCAGDMRFSNALGRDDRQIISTDIRTNQNFYWYKETLAPALVTNPPFNSIREFIDHAFAIGVEKMALVCPERLWACGRGYAQWNRHRPSHWYNLTWREDYLGKGGKPDRALAIAIWNRPHSEQCQYQVLDKQTKQGDLYELHSSSTREEVGAV